MRRYIALILILIMSAEVASCSLPGFAKSRISPDKIFDICVEYDAEDYDDLEELIDDTDNERSMLAGMVIKLTDKDIRKAYYDDTINGIYAIASDEYVRSLYSKKSTAATLLIQGESNDDREGTYLIVSAQEFPSSDEAEDYYGKCCDLFEELQERDSISDTDNDDGRDGDLTYEFASFVTGRTAICNAVYWEGDSVLVVAGYERKTNDLTEHMEEFLGMIELPSPSLEDWDMTAPTVTGNRIEELIEEIGAEEVAYSEFDVITSFLATSDRNTHSSTTDPDNYAEYVDEQYRDKISKLTAVYYRFDPDSTSAQGLTATCVVMMFEINDPAYEEDIFNNISDKVTRDLDAQLQDNTTDDGIMYNTYESTSFINVCGGHYLVDGYVYLIMSLDITGGIGQTRFDRVREIMELP